MSRGGTVVVATCYGNYIYIPFKSPENGATICKTLYEAHQNLKEQAEGGSKMGMFQSFSAGEFDPVAYVPIHAMAGFYVQTGPTHVDAIQRMADLQEKALDPDQDEPWKRGEGA